MVFMANTPVLARAPAIHKALAETGMRLEQGSNTSMPLAERVRGAWSAVSAEHCSEHMLPKGPQAQGAIQEHAVCPSSPWKRRVSSAYRQLSKRQIITSLRQHFAEQPAVCLAQEAVPRAESGP